MSDLIRISDAFSLIDERGAKLGITSTNRCNFKDILRLVKPVDAVEVVRCRECKHENINLAISDKGTWCTYWGIDPDLDDFCSHGERKEATE